MDDDAWDALVSDEDIGASAQESNWQFLGKRPPQNQLQLFQAGGFGKVLGAATHAKPIPGRHGFVFTNAMFQTVYPAHKSIPNKW